MDIQAASDASRVYGWFHGSPAKERSRDLLSGMLSGFVCKIVEYPLDTLKVLQQTNPKYDSAIHTLRMVYSDGGVRALYQGVSSPLLGAMAENATLFVAYGAMKNFLRVDPNATLSNPNPIWKYLVSGAGSGICSAFVLTPVELVKCRLQIQQGTGSKQFSGPVDVVLQTLKSEGVRGLWKGNLSCLAREIPGNVAWFGTYELVKRQFQRSLGCEKISDVPLIWTALSGSCAGVMYWAVPFPADTIKSRIQTDPNFSGLSFISAGRKIVAEHGLGGLYKGLGITCIRAAPSHALIFYFYELSSEWLSKF